jgi:DNA (cytosine-5)-methyltransferase 1
MDEPTLSCIDVFSGAGGLSHGFRLAGFAILAANDFDQHAAATMRATHSETDVLDGPIQDYAAADFLRRAGLKKGELDCLVGGPPCQAFSVYNHQRGKHDERSGLFREYIRIVEGLMPKMVVMENVTGITSVAEGWAVKSIYKRLGELGYEVDHQILKAEEYGVPQERRRIFFVGTRRGYKFTWPTATHSSKGTLFGKPFTTVWQAIGDLPELNILEGQEEQDYTQKPSSEYQRTMRKGARKLFNHVAPFLSEINRERLKHIPQNGSWRDIPVHLLPAGMKLARRCDHTKRYGRLSPDGLSSTILTKCDLHWGAFIHPTQDRTLTVREAARLQSFPDTFRFCGPRSEQFRQVGNAVPPLLARAVALQVAKSLRKEAEMPELVSVG